MRKKITHCYILLTVGVLALSTALSMAQSDSKEPLAVGLVKPTPSLQKAIIAAGKTSSLDRVVEAFDGQLMDRINATRKFDVVGRSDLKEILKEQDFSASGNVDAKTAAQVGKLTGAKYMLVTTVDDFDDITETLGAPGPAGTQRTLQKRFIRLSVIGKIYNTTTGKLKESANFQYSTNDLTEVLNGVARNGTRSDELLVAISRDTAEKIASHVADVIFPAKILIKRDTQVTINRGEGGGVAVGDTFNVFALGEELIDPDTKESLGREEVKEGRVKITQVNPKTSTAQILEDTGIDKGAILRKPQ